MYPNTVGAAENSNGEWIDAECDEGLLRDYKPVRM